MSSEESAGKARITPVEAARGDLYILSAPSGAGKTTLIRGMLEEAGQDTGSIAFSVSHTTREPRSGEVDGRDYHYIDRESFQRMIVEEKFLEWAEVHNNYYGTSYEEVLPRLERGVDVVMDIDVQGAERVMSRYPDAQSVFIMPPSYRDLEKRLARRGLDDPEEVSRRLAVSLWEIRRYTRYKYVIINDDLNRASRVLAAIVHERRHRRERIEERIRRVLEDFDRASKSRSG